MRLGDLNTATAAYQRAIELSPKDKLVQQALQRAIARKRQQDVDSKFCPRCRVENPRRAVYCRNCRTTLTAWAELREGLQQITPGLGLKWGAIVAGACLLLASAGLMLPRTAAMLVGASLALSATLYLYVRALR
jgi:ribosomal protein L40E